MDEEYLQSVNAAKQDEAFANERMKNRIEEVYLRSREDPSACQFMSASRSTVVTFHIPGKMTPGKASGRQLVFKRMAGTYTSFRGRTCDTKGCCNPFHQIDANFNVYDIDETPRPHRQTEKQTARAPTRWQERLGATNDKMEQVLIELRTMRKRQLDYEASNRRIEKALNRMEGLQFFEGTLDIAEMRSELEGRLLSLKDVRDDVNRLFKHLGIEPE